MPNHKHTLPEGPTLNPEYNGLLEKWGKAGYDNKPECEGCGKDLTCKEVYEVRTGWICEACKDEYDNTPQEPTYREDFHSDG